MRILLSNDDGIHAPGIQTLAKALREFAEVQVVAPDRNRSGASNSLTLESSLRTFTYENGDIAVQMGTPTDCVYLGVNALMRPRPDIVVSGINAGPNLGDDVIYSGTVAAAVSYTHLDVYKRQRWAMMMICWRDWPSWAAITVLPVALCQFLRWLLSV